MGFYLRKKKLDSLLGADLAVLGALGWAGLDVRFGDLYIIYIIFIFFIFLYYLYIYFYLYFKCVLWGLSKIKSGLGE